MNGLLSNSPSVTLSTFEGLLFLLRSKHCEYVVPIIPNISSTIRCKLRDMQDMYVSPLFSLFFDIFLYVYFVCVQFVIMNLSDSQTCMYHISQM